MPPTLFARVVRLLRLRQLFRWWGARTLAASGISYAFDVSTLLTSVHLLGLPPSIGAMAGVMVGWASSFQLNRRFAFRQHHAPLGPQVVRFVATAGAAMLIQGYLVGMLVGRFHQPLLLAKVMVDASIFSVGLPLVLRYVVFTRKRAAPAPPPPAPDASCG